MSRAGAIASLFTARLHVEQVERELRGIDDTAIDTQRGDVATLTYRIDEMIRHLRRSIACRRPEPEDGA